MSDSQGSESQQISNASRMANDADIKRITLEWILKTAEYKYSYNFQWLGRRIIQFPQDILMMQEIIWRIRPDLIIETGVAHGGSLVLYASMLELLGEGGHAVGIDIEIREHNRTALLKHALAHRFSLIEKSSTDPAAVRQVQKLAKFSERVLVALDSNHTHDHVLRELQLYAPFVRRGGYIVVFDTVIEDMPEDFFPDRPWGKGNNPKTAVMEFLKTNDRFCIDDEIEEKLLITVAPSGYLRCVKD